MTTSVQLDYKARVRRMAKSVLQNRTTRRMRESAILSVLPFANLASAVHQVKIKLDLKQLREIFGEYALAITMSHRRQLIGI